MLLANSNCTARQNKKTECKATHYEPYIQGLMVTTNQPAHIHIPWMVSTHITRSSHAIRPQFNTLVTGHAVMYHQSPVTL
jgi:hypothetical protein